MESKQIHRSALIVGSLILSLLPFSSVKISATASKATSDSGCMSLRPKPATDLDPDEKVEPVNTEKTLDFRLNQELDFLNHAGATVAILHWYNSDNCKAVKDTGIFLGRAFFAKLINQTESHELGMRAAGWVLTHEWVHMYQFQVYGDEVKKLAIRELEMQADFQAGMWMGLRISESDFRGYTEAAKLSFQLGSADWNNPDVHGTPLQRERAVITGVEAGRRLGMRQYPPTWDLNKYGPLLAGRPVMDWSLLEVREILNRK